jgi:hypothetical protein
MICFIMVTMVTILLMEHTQHSKIIDRLGGTVAVARLCKVSSQAVSKWRTYGIPESRFMYLQLLKPEIVKEEQPDSEKAA